ncbi:MAG: MlaD family protein [Candidatus Brocadiales bacterium]
MASTALKVRVGIFVIVGICLAVGAVIALFAWLGVEDTTFYVSYVSESTSGLEKDAPVKYKGVKIGRVKKIRVAPDGQLVEVVMEIDSAFDMKPEFISRVKYAGITGLRYVEIEPMREGMKVETTDFSFKPKYPVIPSAFSDLEQLGITLEKTFENINKFDVKTISDKLTALLDSLDTLVTELKAKDTIGNLNAAAAQLSNPKIGQTVDYLESTTKKLSKLLAELEAGNLPDKLNAFLDEGVLLSRNLNVLSFELQGMAQLDNVMRATSATVKELNQTLKRSPSTMLFSQPPQPRQISRD